MRAVSVRRYVNDINTCCAMLEIRKKRRKKNIIEERYNKSNKKYN